MFHFSHGIIRCLLAIVLLGSGLLTATAAEQPFTMTGKIAYSTLEGGFYGIIGDDGIKYQPTKIPFELRKHDLVVRFTAIHRDDMFTAFNWGKLIQLQTIKPFPSRLSEDERIVIHALAKRLDSFNQRDLTQLKSIDQTVQSLSATQFSEWLAGYQDFQLRSITISDASPNRIVGSYWYTRKPGHQLTLQDADINVTGQNFTLQHTNSGWMIAELAPYKAALTAAQLEAMLQQAETHFGTQDLATLL